MSDDIPEKFDGFILTDDPQGQARIHLAAGLIFEKMRDYRSAIECYSA